MILAVGLSPARGASHFRPYVNCLKQRERFLWDVRIGIKIVNNNLICVSIGKCTSFRDENCIKIRINRTHTTAELLARVRRENGDSIFENFEF